MLYSKLGHYFRSNAFMRHNAIFFFGSLFIAALNYLYYPVIGRLVSVEEFGEIQALISLFTQLGILLTAFGYVVTNIINNSSHKATEEEVLLNLEKITLIASLLMLVFVVIGGYLFKNTLQFSSTVSLFLVGILVILNVPSTSRTYFLQGLQRMGEVAISGILFAASKLLLSVVLILLGSNVVAVMAGYISAQLLTLGYLWYKTRGRYPSLRRSLSFSRSKKRDKGLLRQELTYGIATLVLLSGITLLYISDTVLVRLFVPPEDAGAYSAVSAIGRIVYFITASVSGVLIASVKLAESKKVNLALLRRSFLLVSLIGGGVAIIFSLLPTLTITLLLGERYATFAYLLPLVTVLMLICAYNNLLVCYQIALRRFKAIYIVVVGLIIFALMLGLWHDTLTAIVIAYLTSNAVTCMLLLVQIMKGKQYV